MNKATKVMAAVAALGVMAPIPAAMAKSPVKTTKGTCTGHSTAKMKAKLSNGRIEAEFEVDQNRSGVLWNWTIARAGTTIRSGATKTHAPSGSFSVTRRVANKPGPDALSMRATRANGEVCTASLTF